MSMSKKPRMRLMRLMRHVGGSARRRPGALAICRPKPFRLRNAMARPVAEETEELLAEVPEVCVAGRGGFRSVALLVNS